MRRYLWLALVFYFALAAAGCQVSNNFVTRMTALAPIAPNTGCTRGWPNTLPMQTGTSTYVWHITSPSPTDDTPAVTPNDGTWTMVSAVANMLPGDPGHKITFTKAGTYNVIWADGTTRPVTVVDHPPTGPAVNVPGIGPITSFATITGKVITSAIWNGNVGTQNLNDLTFVDCTWEGCSLDSCMGSCWEFDNPRFNSTSVTGSGWGAAYIGARFEGFAPGVNLGIQNGGNTFFGECSFDHTQRGPCFQAQQGQLSQNVYFLNTTLSHISWVSGGCEWALFEGAGAAQDVYFLHTRVSDCPGCLTFAHNINGNVWFTDVQGQSGGVYAYSFNPGYAQQGVVLDLWHHTGGNVAVDASMKNMLIENTDWYSPDPGGASMFYARTPVPAAPFQSSAPAGSGNTLHNVRTWRTAPMLYKGGMTNGFIDDGTNQVY